MPLMIESAGANAGSASARLMVVGDDPGLTDQIIRLLSDQGFHAERVASRWWLEAVSRGDRPDLVILTDPESAAGAPGVRALARLGVAVLAVTDGAPGPSAGSGGLFDVDDWVVRSSLDSELSARVGRLLRRRASPPAAAARGGSKLPVGQGFFALVIHDLRTPLNVVGLSLRMLGKALPRGNPETDEDLRFVEENFHHIDRMLTLLADFVRLFEAEGPPAATPFSPRRMVEEVVEGRAAKAGAKKDVVVVEAGSGCPDEVVLDPLRARLALHYILANASAAAAGAPIRLTMEGGPDRWVISAVVEKPPPPSVKPVALSPYAFERLCGQAAERRGIDLAVAAKVSEMFGGLARLDVLDGRATAVVLDWPARLATA
jgi:signal transduction histidine kinase